LITELPPSRGFDSIMVVVDHGLSKGVIIISCLKTITSEGVAKLFFKHVYRQFRLHDKVISDWGPQFISKFSHALAKLLDYTVRILYLLCTDQVDILQTNANVLLCVSQMWTLLFASETHKYISFYDHYHVL
jgi:hypothetical protein